jgi:hypothetical protein
LAGKQAANRLLVAWADLEARLDRGRGGLSLAAVLERDSIETRQMRALDRRFDRLSRRLSQAVREMEALPATTQRGVRLKIEAALTYTDPSERTEAPWSLVESALRDFDRGA